MALNEDQQLTVRTYLRTKVLTRMSQVQLGRRMGYNQNTISQILTGHRAVSMGFVNAMAEALNIDAIDLLGLRDATKGLPLLGDLPGWKVSEKEVRKLRPETQDFIFDAIRGGRFNPCPDEMTPTQLLDLVRWAEEAYKRRQG